MQQVEAIRSDWKLSDIEQRYPHVIEELVRLSPAFGEMQNPEDAQLRKRLVTVEQAAQMIGVDTDEMLARLNQAAGIETTIPDTLGESNGISAPEEGTEPEWLDHGNISRTLDVRPFQQRGEEPFSPIMRMATDVPFGTIFSLRNTFEPVPLYSVLGNKGFLHHAVQHGENDWEIFFYRTDASAGPGMDVDDNRPEPPEIDRHWDDPTATLTIDVSELVPPEPMIRILEALEELPSGSSLLVHHVRRPMHLYPRLDELGYQHETRDIGPGQVQVLITKPVQATRTDA